MCIFGAASLCKNLNTYEDTLPCSHIHICVYTQLIIFSPFHVACKYSFNNTKSDKCEKNSRNLDTNIRL